MADGQTVIEFSAIAVPLGIAMGLSLTVERVLEFLKRILTSTVSIEDVKRLSDIGKIHEKYLALGKLMPREMAQRGADASAAAVAEALVRTTDEEKRRALIAELQAFAPDAELSERTSSTSVSVADATLPRSERVQREFLLQMFGFALGIVLARFSELRLFQSFGMANFEPWVDYLLTGLLIGGGSAPVHTLMQFISERKVSASPSTVVREEGIKPVAKKAEKKTPSPIAAQEPPEMAKLREIHYSGGVDREKLEWVHVRKSNPSMIIYHHTAMKRSSSFEDVVNVIKSRTDSKGNHWITGYHCVITEDGGIHPFCRWDRSGNHATGLNDKSLGISFNGNFETDASVPFANFDGRFGPALPTNEQLDGGARIVALWCHLYEIPLNFKERIIPHSQVSDKTCPGRNFPTKMFEELVTSYYKVWASGEAKAYIDAFAHKPYVRV